MVIIKSRKAKRQSELRKPISLIRNVLRAKSCAVFEANIEISVLLRSALRSTWVFTERHTVKIEVLWETQGLDRSVLRGTILCQQKDKHYKTDATQFSVCVIWVSLCVRGLGVPSRGQAIDSVVYVWVLVSSCAIFVCKWFTAFFGLIVSQYMRTKSRFSDPQGALQGGLFKWWRHQTQIVSQTVHLYNINSTFCLSVGCFHLAAVIFKIRF